MTDRPDPKPKPRHVPGLGIRSELHPEWIYLTSLGNGMYVNEKTGKLAFQVDQSGPPKKEDVGK